MTAGNSAAESTIYLEPEVQRRIHNRLKRIEGQVRGIQRLLSEHQPCDDLLVQLGAVKQALNGVTVELLMGHLETCVAESMKEGQGTEALEILHNALTQALRHGG
jgi:CsoR family transcriptional regulator, copper-sensing transcriptional repressor